jgi:hypothetical protein
MGETLFAIVKFFADPKNGALEKNKPPAMKVRRVALAYSIKPPVL